MSVVALLLLTVAVVFLAAVLVRLTCLIGELEEATIGIQGDIATIAESLSLTDANIYVIESRGRIHSEALKYIVDALLAGVKVRDTVTTLYHPFLVELLFNDGVSATKLLATHSEIGHDDEIEILYDEDDAPGLSVTFDHQSLCTHPRHGFTEMTIPVEDTIDAFRDRLVGDGWKITSPEDDEESDDEVHDNAESLGAGK